VLFLIQDYYAILRTPSLSGAVLLEGVKCIFLYLFTVQYIIVLALLFIVQFVVACACLAIGPSQQKSLFHTGWYEAEGLRGKMQRQFDCCGAFPEADNYTDLYHPPCNLTSVSLCACYVRYKLHYRYVK